MIDAHIHFWRVARGDNDLDPSSPLWRDYEPADLEPHLMDAGIERIVVVQAAATHAENLYTIGLAARYPTIAAIVAWIDPQSAAVEEEIAALKQTGIVKGFRPIKNANWFIGWMLEPAMARGYRAMAEAGMTLDVLVENPEDVPVVTELARRHPELTIVLDHCGKPDIAGGRFQPWADQLGELGQNTNVMCKFSALLNRAAPSATVADIKPYADHVLATFGADRTMWASDWPPLERSASYAHWRAISTELLAHLTAGQRTSVLEGTASRTYRLAT